MTNPSITAHLPNGAPASPRPSTAALMAVSGRQLVIAVRLLLAMTVILGIMYPLAVFGIGRIWAPEADGSLVSDTTGHVVGSSLIGQQFTGPQWFKGRPSASDYDAIASGGSNLAADSAELKKQIGERRASIAAADGVAPSQVPPDALTASGSGLDPDISPAYADIQAARVAASRHLPLKQVQDLIQHHIIGRQFGFLGQERVNVLQLNLALDALQR